MLFASGDLTVWLVIRREQAIGSYYDWNAGTPRTIEQSSGSSTPYTFDTARRETYTNGNREGFPIFGVTGPTWVESYSVSTGADVVYAENSVNNYLAVKHRHSGADVYIR